MTLRIVATASFPAETGAGEREHAIAALGRIGDGVPEIERSHAGLHLPGSLGAGDLTWDFSVADDAALATLRRGLEESGWDHAFGRSEAADREFLRLLTGIEAWVIEPIAQSVPRDDLVGVKRTNLVRVADSASPELVERWSREVVALAAHVPAIRNWSLARTHALPRSEPRVRWTHAWEQEFETLAGLLEDYMASPYHWGWLDGWYDAEVPFCIVEPDLAHLYCAASANVLGWTRDPCDAPSRPLSRAPRGPSRRER